MEIEKEIFKRSNIAWDQLIPYGFQKQGDKYLISKKILNDSFRIDVVISKDGNVQGKIFDFAFEEEYRNYRIENQVGEFINKVREEFENFLIEIKNHCTIPNYFITNQANRITNLINQEYHDSPEFPWNDLPGSGIFRHSNNKKWYGLIMNINRNKIDNGNEEVEILNVKLEEEEIQKLLKQKGFYHAYHMNKKNWITIILNDTVTDEIIMDCIRKSYQLTNHLNEWLIPANPNYYDMIHCFDTTDTIFWKQSSNINVGDIIYLYIGSPYSAIFYQCKVLEVNIPYEYKDKNISMTRGMKIKLMKRYQKEKYTFTKLIWNKFSSRTKIYSQKIK